MRHVGGTLAALLVSLALTAPQLAQGQVELRLDLMRVYADHDLLGAPTVLGVSIGTRLTRRVGVRLGLQHGGDDFSSAGTTCVGLVFPDADCGPEARAEESTISALVLGVPVTGSLAWGRVAFVPELRRLVMKSRQEGSASGRVRSAEKVAWGLGLGGELEVFVWDRPRIGLHVGVHSAVHPWFDEEIIADGYTPFEETVHLTWLELGVTLRR